MVAAGRATRFGSDAPKQFLDLAGRTVLEWSVRAVGASTRVRGVVVVLSPDEIGGPRAAAVGAVEGVISVVPGGETRAESVRLGLAAAADAEYVLVHDAARPAVSAALVDAVVDATVRHGAAVPVLRVVDTVKEDDGRGFVAGTVDRSLLRLAQTPQGSRADWLREALDRARRDGVTVTDEAQVLERAGHKVALVAGEPDNVKITRPEDLEALRRRIEGPGGDLRIGNGFDAHRFGAERRLVLGGVEFPAEPGLVGHSDADVVIHAAMDALLGAAALGDIGVHFPPDEPCYAGVASTELAGEVAGLLTRSGWEVINVDITLLAERPRISTRVDAMRRAIASSLGVAADRIGLKATTLEGMGALGRAEGIACHASALIRRRRSAP